MSDTQMRTSQWPCMSLNLETFGPLTQKWEMLRPLPAELPGSHPRPAGFPALNAGLKSKLRSQRQKKSKLECCLTNPLLGRHQWRVDSYATPGCLLVWSFKRKSSD